MSARTMRELLLELSRAEKLLRAASSTSSERTEASATLAALFEEIGKRTERALGLALAATLLPAAEGDTAVSMMLGGRLLTEMRRRGLEVLPTGDLPSV